MNSHIDKVTANVHAYAEIVDALTSEWLDTVALSARSSDLLSRSHLSANLERDVKDIDTILTRLNTDITRSAVDLSAHSRLESSTPAGIQQMADEQAAKHHKWIDYAEARIGAAEVLYDSMA